jgi:hypothetical protein
MRNTFIISLVALAALSSGARAETAKRRDPVCEGYAKIIKCMNECDATHFVGCDKNKPSSCSNYTAKFNAAWECKIKTKKCGPETQLSDDVINKCSRTD